jgi:hypothetical protein
MDRNLFGYHLARRLRILLGEERFRRLGRVLPQFRLCDREEADPWLAARQAAAAWAQHGVAVAGSRVLVVGCGPSNGLGYALAAMGAAQVVCQDDTACFDVGQDAKHLAAMTTRFPAVKFSVVKRAAQLDKLREASFQACLSEAAGPVDPAARVAAVRRLLAPGGVVVHTVVFHEPLGRYPYHRLLCARAAGKRLAGRDEAGPWRCDDHIAALTAAGFDVAVAAYESDLEAFAAVADRLHRDYADRDPGLLAVTHAVLVGSCLRRPGGASPLLDHPTGGHDAPRTPSQGEG